jgi:hypothetical protein
MKYRRNPIADSVGVSSSVLLPNSYRGGSLLLADDSRDDRFHQNRREEEKSTNTYVPGTGTLLAVRVIPPTSVTID